jgi:hypothetical protein
MDQLSSLVQLPHRHLNSVSVARITALLVVSEGLAVAAYVILFSSVDAGDFQAFYFAAEHVIEGEPFVGRAPPTGANTAWVFPPITVLYFLPFTLFDSWLAAYVAQILVIAVLSLLGAVILYRIHPLSEAPLAMSSKALLTLAILVNPFAILNFGQGQMNIHVLVLILTGVYWSQSGSEYRSGIVFGVAALIKLWPAVLGFWLLWRRQWSAVGAAIVTGITGLVLGGLLFGLQATRTWWTVITARRSLTAELSGGVSPGVGMIALERPMSVLFPALPPVLFVTVCIIGGGAALLLLYRYSPSQSKGLATAGATIAIALLVVPAATLPYLLVPLVIGLGLLFVSDEISYRSRFLLIIGILVSGVPVGYEEISAIAGVAGIQMVGDGVLSVALAIFPPEIIGLLVLAVGHTAASLQY